MYGEQIDADRRSVIAAVSRSSGATPSSIASPAPSVPDVRLDTAPPPNSAPPAPLDASVTSPTEAAATTVVVTEPAKGTMAATVPAATTTEATEDASTAAPEPPPQPVAAAGKPKKKAVAAKKPQRTARHNRSNRNPYDAYAWRQPNWNYWRGSGYQSYFGRPFW
jgi:hypothetical protein